SGPFGLAQLCILSIRTSFARDIGRCERSRAMSQAENEDRQSQEQQSGDNGGESAQGGGGARGFAAMDNQKQREIASKGGAAVSRNREYMAAIGKKGG